MPEIRHLATLYRIVCKTVANGRSAAGAYRRSDLWSPTRSSTRYSPVGHCFPAAQFGADHLAGTIVVLMRSGGNTLEQFAVAEATSVLRALAARVPTLAQGTSEAARVVIIDSSLSKVLVRG